MYVSCAEICIFFLQAFKSRCKVHSLQIEGPDDGRAPKLVKLFVNRAVLGFEDAEAEDAEQTLELVDEQLGNRIELRFVKFQNVDRLSIFVGSNQNDEDTSAVTAIRLWGTGVHTTNSKFDLTHPPHLVSTHTFPHIRTT